MFWVATTILALTYIGVAITRLPRINVDRPSAAFSGAVLMVLFGVLSFDAAVRAIDFHIIALLLGMMMLVAALERAGFFVQVARRLLSVGTTPFRLLVVVVAGTGVLSALLVNDTVVLFLTPVVIQACRMLRANPVPYLLAEAMASNIGSTATIVGNPQNMLIGITSGITFTRFFLHLAPVAIAGCLALIAIVWLAYRREFSQAFDRQEELLRAGCQDQTTGNRWIWLILVLVIGAFFLSSTLRIDVSLIALVTGAAVLLISHARPSEVIARVDWVLLLFFVGLFVVIGGAREAGVMDVMLRMVSVTPDLPGIISLHLASAIISQLVSNVPLTMLVIPIIEGTPGNLLWLSLAAGATLGGNATLIGAVANIIVVERASREGVIVSFGEFLKVGVWVTLATLAISVGILALEWQLGLLV
jgi:Na+/H+ antiporter NhaD/arsenite permease-like protein